MATAAQLRAFAGSSVEITPEQMVRKIREAMLVAFYDPDTGETVVPWQSVSADGVSNNRIPLGEMQRMLEFWIAQQSGGIVAQYAEFPP